VVSHTLVLSLYSDETWLTGSAAYRASPNPKPVISLAHPLLPFPAQIGAFFVMYPFNSTIVRRSWYLSRLPDNRKDPFADPDGSERANPQGEEPRHGEQLEYEEGMDVGGSKVVAGLLSFGLFGFFALFNYSGIVSLWYFTACKVRRS
jgi:hypothetical protein